MYSGSLWLHLQVKVQQRKLVGVPSVFAISMFCLEERASSRWRELLHYAFDKYPDKTYCICYLPFTASEPLMLRSFTRINVKADDNGTAASALYVIHRYGLLPSFNVRLMTAEDTEQVKTIPSHSNGVTFVSKCMYVLTCTCVNLIIVDYVLMW